MFNLSEYFNKQSPQIPAESGPGSHAERIQVATCVLLLQMARSDDEFSDAERETITALLKKDFGLSEEVVAELLDLSHKKLEESIDLWQYTNLIKKNYSLDDKIGVIESIWKVVYADGKLDPHEDYLVHKLSQLLGLSHKQLIDAKMRVRRKE
jgi:uncharacterized tellurite resistance protein B-like protein